MTRTTEATYEDDLAEAWEFLAPRMARVAAEAEARYDDQLVEHFRKHVGDMLNDFWNPGLAIREWVNLAAKHAGI